MHAFVKDFKQAKSPSSIDSCVIVRMAKKKPSYTICKYVLPKWHIIKAWTYSSVEILWRINLFFGVLTVLSWLAYHSCSFGVSFRCTSVSLVSRPIYKLPIVVFWGSVFSALLGDIDPLSTGSPEFSGASFLVFFYMLLPAGSFPSEWVPEVLGI